MRKKVLEEQLKITSEIVSSVMLENGNVLISFRNGRNIIYEVDIEDRNRLI